MCSCYGTLLGLFSCMCERMRGIMLPAARIGIAAPQALVDPMLMPAVRPVLDFLEDVTPGWLKQPSTLVPNIKACAKPVARK